jgi:hypothetical protein
MKHLQMVGHMPKPVRTMSRRIMVAVGFTGLVRCEWMFARYGQVIPCNWEMVEFQMWLPTFGPLGYLVAEQRNLAVKALLDSGHEWLFFIDHDTVLPLNFLLTINERILKENIPVWSGLYFTKSVPSEPLMYRGNGTGYYTGWKMGDKVWVDGIPMGCTVIHRSILEVMYRESEEYEANGQVMRRVFHSPRAAWEDPATKQWQTQSGTEDLHWCWRVIDEDIFRKAGWPKYARKKYPFMVDTGLFCKHIDMDGVQYPSRGEEKYFERKKK